jgi:hypothetical protein
MWTMEKIFSMKRSLQGTFCLCQVQLVRLLPRMLGKDWYRVKLLPLQQLQLLRQPQLKKHCVFFEQLLVLLSQMHSSGDSMRLLLAVLAASAHPLAKEEAD